jgi:hypothetical protein
MKVLCDIGEKTELRVLGRRWQKGHEVVVVVIKIKAATCHPITYLGNELYIQIQSFLCALPEISWTSYVMLAFRMLNLQ